jgi:hypothetical protein
MYARILYIAAIFTVLTYFSCNTREKDMQRGESEQETSGETFSKRSVLITPMDKTGVPNITREVEAKTYQNTTLFANKKIGDLVEEDMLTMISVKFNVEAPVIDDQPAPAEAIVYAYTQTKWQLSITLDNDIFDNRDYYFTNGLSIELVAPFMDRSPVRYILPGSKGADIDQNGISITQNIYTPTNPDTTIILQDDHPFSSFLVAGQFRDNYNLKKKLRIRSDFRIGVLGPSSMGQQVQTSIHEIRPVGWQNQVNNDIVIDYAVLVEKGIISNSYFELNVMGKANIGTLYNKIGGGLNLRAGNFMPVFKGPFSIFENKNPGGRVQFWMFAKSQFDLVGYDATLQGGMFTNGNIYVIDPQNLSRFVFRASMGFAFYYNNIGLEYEHYYETPRFTNAYHFGWGSLKAVLAF